MRGHSPASASASIYRLSSSLLALVILTSQVYGWSIALFEHGRTGLKLCRKDFHFWDLAIAPDILFSFLLPISPDAMAAVAGSSTTTAQDAAVIQTSSIK